MSECRRGCSRTSGRSSPGDGASQSQYHRRVGNQRVRCTVAFSTAPFVTGQRHNSAGRDRHRRRGRLQPAPQHQHHYEQQRRRRKLHGRNRCGRDAQRNGRAGPVGHRLLLLLRVRQRHRDGPVLPAQRHRGRWTVGAVREIQLPVDTRPAEPVPVLQHMFPDRFHRSQELQAQRVVTQVIIAVADPRAATVCCIHRIPTISPRPEKSPHYIECRASANVTKQCLLQYNILSKSHTFLLNIIRIDFNVYC